MSALPTYFIPHWISVLFLIAIPLPFILIVQLIRNQGKKGSNRLAYVYVLIFFVLFLAFIAFASNHGLFNVVSFPPKVLLYTTFPYSLLLFVFVINSKFYKKNIEEASLEELIKLHVFRIIGVFFILLAVHDALPKPFAYIAGLGDIITALSSIAVAKAVRYKKTYAKTAAYLWNTFGFIDILFTAVAANILTFISVNTGSMGVDSLAVFPFCIIPAFAPPTILFLHWTVFQKLRKDTL